MSGQTRKHSIFESLANVIVGYGIAVAAQALIFPWFGLYTQAAAHFKIALVFTGISLVRSYILRRVWNKIMLRKRGLS